MNILLVTTMECLYLIVTSKAYCGSCGSALYIVGRVGLHYISWVVRVCIISWVMRIYRLSWDVRVCSYHGSCVSVFYHVLCVSIIILFIMGRVCILSCVMCVCNCLLWVVCVCILPWVMPVYGCHGSCVSMLIVGRACLYFTLGRACLQYTVYHRSRVSTVYHGLCVYLFHSHVTSVARKNSRLFYQSDGGLLQLSTRKIIPRVCGLEQ